MECETPSVPVQINCYITILNSTLGKDMPSSVRKRRRSSSHNEDDNDDDDVRRKEKKNGRNDVISNPFLRLFQGKNSPSSSSTSPTTSDGSKGICDDTFERVIDFMTLTRSSSSMNNSQGGSLPSSSSLGDKKEEESIPEIAQQLLKKLIQNREIGDTANTSQLISIIDIVNLLLPWAIKTILRSSLSSSSAQPSSTSFDLEWKVIHQCTELFLEYQQRGSSSSVIQALTNHFSLSNLHKLVPLAWTVALTEESSPSGPEDLLTRKLAASCFLTWTQQLYRPSFDVVCQSLVPLAGNAAQRRLQYDPTPTTTTTGTDIYDELSSATLHLLLTTLEKANPKKAFSTLIQPHLISALSDLYSAPAKDLSTKQSMVRQLIERGIFHVDHHIDGFRSIQMGIPSLDDILQKSHDNMADREEEQSSPSKSSFQCYQQGLLTMVQHAFAVSSSNLRQAASIARIVQLLLEGFFQATEQLKGKPDESAGKKKATANKIRQLQMAFFANLTKPILCFTCSLVQIDAVGVRTLCESLYQCTNLLLNDDIYLPSVEDEGMKNFGFLQGLSRALIRSSVPDLAIRSFPILATTLQLNHLVFHEDLSLTIVSCLSALESMNETSPTEFVPFFCQMIITYKRLRQLDYLCIALRSAAVDLTTQGRVSALQSFLELIGHVQVIREFGDAVHDSPIQQIKEIVSAYNHWIQTNAACSGSDPKSLSGAIPIVVKVFCHLLKSLRIDTAAAQELSPICHDIESTSIKALIPESSSLKSLDSRSRQGLLLSAWTLDMSNRCDFWIRNSKEVDKDEDFDLPISVLSILSEGIEQVLINSRIDFNGALEELLLLACHRLQQLQGRIQEKQRIAFATDAEEFSIESDIKETKETANFALKAIKLENVDGSNFNPLWDSLATTMGSWAPFVDDESMRWFLLHLCTRVSIDESSDNSAVWLLRDASFFETPKVLENFGPAVLGHVSSSLQQLFPNTKSTDTYWRDLLCSPISCSWAPLDAAALDRMLRRKNDVSVSDNALSRLPGILREMRTLNSIKAAVWHFAGQCPAWLETCVRIDYICGALVKQNRDWQPVLIDLMSEVRVTMSRLWLENQQDVTDQDVCRIIISHLFESTRILVRESCTKPSRKHRLIDSTKGAISSLIRAAPERSFFQGLVDEYSGRKINRASGQDFVLLIHFGSVIVDALPTTKQTQSLVQNICDATWDYATRLIVESGDAESSDLQAAFLLVSEILRRKRQNSDTMKSLRTMILSGIQSVNEKDDSKVEYLAYLVGCYAVAEPSRECRRTLFDSLTGFSGALPEIIDDALCQFAVAMSPVELGECLARLTEDHNAHTGSRSRLRLFRLIILNGQSEEHFDALSRSSYRIFSLALGAMTSSHARSCKIGEGVALIQALASNRKIMTMQERELYLILSHATGALQLPCNDQAAALSKPVFDACFSIISFLLQRFSKQLHNCIPSVIGCLCAVLGRCLYDELPDLEIIDRGHKFSRLTELLLPFGDVYKKHVLPLIVEFVQALKRDMNPTRRSSLSPAVYCLLDILQQHETSQLNSMLDDMGRAMLRTVHESYKKQHVYKGQ